MQFPGTYSALTLVNLTVSAVLALYTAGCGGASVAEVGTSNYHTPAVGSTTTDDTFALSSNGVPVLDAPVRLTAVDDGGFEPGRTGGDFAADLSRDRVSADGDNGHFNPDWDRETGCDEPAYCLYRLSLDPGSDETILQLTWTAASPGVATAWAGFSNWDEGTWDWYEVDHDAVSLEEPDAYSDDDLHCYVAVVILGTDPVDLAAIGFGPSVTGSYVIVDTNQSACYSDTSTMAEPSPGGAFYGQDAQYDGAQPSYRDNGDGTVTDLVTGLMWQQSYGPGEKITFDGAFDYADGLELAGYTDWRVPTIKELYSLIDFSGSTGLTVEASTPYINTAYFDFAYGDESAGERLIDAQYITSTEYTSTTMGGDVTMFGVNFADGRIKGYPEIDPPTQAGKEFFIRCVRGNPDYGVNDFVDNGDGTITDRATGLTWLQDDSVLLDAGPRGDGLLNWEEALAWAEDCEYAGYDDWRLPNIKELQSLVDYTRCPDMTASAAIDPLFNTGVYIDGNGLADYHYYWSSTTHVEEMSQGANAGYVSFGEALGWMESPPNSGNLMLLDVHGAGAQRSDPKSGDPDDFPYGRGPQGDVICIFNCVRLVKGISG